MYVAILFMGGAGIYFLFVGCYKNIVSDFKEGDELNYGCMLLIFAVVLAIIVG